MSRSPLPYYRPAERTFSPPECEAARVLPPELECGGLRELPGGLRDVRGRPGARGEAGRAGEAAAGAGA